MTTRTGDPTLVRELNLSIVLNALRESPPSSRAQLAKMTGLSKATVSSLVEELLRAGFVREIGFGKRDEVGRPAIGLELNPKAGCIIGGEIGVDFVSVILSNFAAEIIWRHQEQTAGGMSQQHVLARVLEIIRDATARADREGQRVLGLGLGVPGLVDSQTGTLLFAPNLGWHDFPLLAILEREFKYPVYVDNEANLAALGESYFGAARGCSDVLYISAGVGLGGGVVLNGRVLPGAFGFAGEVGHMTLLLDGPLCNCGNRGCWETLASQEALFKRVRAAVAAGARSNLPERTHGDLDHLTVPLIVDAAREHDEAACRSLEETGQYLGIGIANLINALNPERVVFGGILSLASDFLIPVIEEVVQARALKWSRRGLKIISAEHGFDASAMGGIAKVYQHVLSQPKAAGANRWAASMAPIQFARR